MLCSDVNAPKGYQDKDLKHELRKSKVQNTVGPLFRGIPAVRYIRVRWGFSCRALLTILAPRSATMYVGAIVYAAVTNGCRPYVLGHMGQRTDKTHKNGCIDNPQPVRFLDR